MRAPPIWFGKLPEKVACHLFMCCDEKKEDT